MKRATTHPRMRSTVAAVRAALAPTGRRMFAGMFATFACAVQAAAPLPAGTLPVPSSQWVGSGAATRSTANGTLTVTQTTPRAVLNWQSFNVAPDAAVRFVQPDAAAATLNRIHDANPSIIQGRLSANGQVYLYNRNGILFDRGAQVNVGALVATTLNVSDQVFERGLLSQERADQAVFSFDGSAADFGRSFVRVEEGAEIRTATSGRVMLFAPRVENAGTIATPEGQAVLAAGAKVYLAASADNRLRGFLVEVDPLADGAANPGGRVTNEAVGRIVAERGNATLVGLAVNQSGRVSATTSASLNGSVTLLARDTAVLTAAGMRGSRGGAVVLGPGSTTEVRPDTTDTRTTQDDQVFLRSQVTVAGASIHMQQGARIVAPSGDVTLTAQRGLDFQTTAAGVPGVRVQMDRDAVIDVAGLRDVEVALERNIVATDLRGNELKDSPLQRDGPLRNRTVRVDVRTGTPLADVSAAARQIGRTVAERSTAGGTVTLRSEGDVVLRDGSRVDVSGGSIRYRDGYLSTTKLYTADGKIVDIGVASPDLLYLGIADEVVVRNEKFGQSQTLQAQLRGEFTPGYVEGRDAGTVTVTAPRVVLDAALRGETVIGPQQREQAARPAGGALVLGDPSDLPAPPDFKLRDVVFVRRPEAVGPASSRPNVLPESFAFDAEVPQIWAETLFVPTETVNEWGFTRVTVLANGAVTLPAGERLVLAPWGSLRVTARRVDVGGSIVAPGASVTLATVATAVALPGVPAAADYALSLGPSAEISTAGTWVNDSPRAAPVGALAPIVANGGSVSLVSVADLLLAPGSRLDVSGGAYLSATERLRSGNAGSISLRTGRFGLNDFEPQTSRLVLGSELLGYAPGAGGALTIAASSVSIGATAGTAPGQLHLDPGFFAQGGFRRYTVSGQDGVDVAQAATVTVLPQALVLDASFAAQPTGSSLAVFSRREPLPAERRSGGEITLAAGSRFRGGVTVGADARIAVDPGGRIALTAGRQITIEGTLSAPAGSLSAAIAQPGSFDGFEPGQSIWLGPQSALLAGGVLRPRTDRSGLQLGDVLAGGTVVLDAASGYVITRAGARIDVSGASAPLDVLRQNGPQAGYERVMVGSAAGRIELSAREGLLLDGVLLGHAGAPGTAGGTLLLTLERATLPLGYPAQGPRRLLLSGNGAAAAEGLDAGAPVPSERNGVGRVPAAEVVRGGFHRLVARAENEIVLDGTVDLALARGIELDAPILAAAPGASAMLTAGYLSLANREQARQSLATSPAAGDGLLSLRAAHVDIEGAVTLSGLAGTRIDASGDLRLRGVLTDLATGDFAARLRASGDLELRAAQVYPATATHGRIEAIGAGATLSILPAGDAAPPLSAGGALVLAAPNVVIAGTVRAPFGAIAVEAATALHVAPGAVLSVSGDGLLVPFGATELSGRRYVYPVAQDTARIVAAPPEKRVSLVAPAILLAEGARIDLSGGGDLFATEFLPGTGGSKDVLAPANAAGTYAILPGRSAGFAAHDPYYSLGVTDLLPGDSVAISGVPGLADGVYPLLPARYGLLPGAWLVTPLAGTRDLVAAQSYQRADGNWVVPGQRVAAGLAGEASRDARTSGFAVGPGALARTRSEYRDTTAGTFFANGGAMLPRDAGRLVLGTTGELTLAAVIASQAAAGGLGAEVDIAAPRIVVTASEAQAVAPGAVRLAAGQLDRLGAASLLLGGRRELEDGAVRVRVEASEVIVANDAASVLRAPEILLAATDRVQLAPGAAVEASGVAAIAQRPIVIGADGGAGGDGALLHVAAGEAAVLSRLNVQRARGLLEVGPGASVAATGTIRLDATLDTRLAGAVVLGPAGSLALGAGRISLGDTAGVEQGLVLSNAQLAALGTPRELVLRSYTSVDLYGAVELGTGGLERLRIESGGLGGYANGGHAAVLKGAQVVLAGGDGFSFSPAPPLASGTLPAAGNGTLAIEAGTLILGEGSFEIRGFDDATASAATAVQVAGSGRLATAGAVVLGSPVVTTADGVRFDVVAGGTLTLAGAPPGAPAPRAGVGGVLGLTGRSVSIGARVELPSGELRAQASGTGADDGVRLLAGGRVSVAGTATPFADTQVTTPGGWVSLSAAVGGVALDAGSLLDVSAPAGADAGGIEIAAPAGRFSAAGTLLAATGGGTGTARAGSLSVDAAGIDDFAGLQRRLDAAVEGGAIVAGGFAHERSLRVRTGSLEIPQDLTLAAAQVHLAADTGSVKILGTIDASGPKGGRVEIHAGGSGRLELAAGGRIVARATSGPEATSGTQGRGGQVTLGAGLQGALDLAPGAVIDVAPAGAGERGSVVLRASRSGNDVAVERIQAAITGAGDVTIEAVRVYDSAGGAAVTSIGTTAAAGRLTPAQLAADGNAYLSTTNVAAMRARLGLTDSADTTYAVRAGIEVRAAGDLVLANDWSLLTARPGGSPGVLTLRAGGDLRLDASLSDGFSTAAANGVQQSGPSWSYRLVAGADLAAADPLAVRVGTGDLRVAPGRIVRTGTGDIALAAGRDVVLAYTVRDDDPAPGVVRPVLDAVPGVVYTAGRTSAAFPANLFPTINISGVAATFPTGGGDLRIRAGRDIAARSVSPLDIATAPLTQFFTDWLWRQGALAADGTTGSSSAPRTAWWPRFAEFRQGFGALGGGDVELRAAGAVDSVAVSVPTNGRLPAPANSIPDPALLAVLGGGDLTVRARGDVDSSAFLVDRGTLRVEAGGSIGSSRLTGTQAGRPLYTSVLLGAGEVRLQARGDVGIETVTAFTTVEQVAGNFLGGGGNNRRSYFFGYDASSRVLASASTGDVLLANDPIGLGQTAAQVLARADALYLYPPSLRVEAPRGDVLVGGDFVLFPAAAGELGLFARGAIDVRGRIGMMDVLPERLPSPVQPDRNTGRIVTLGSGLSETGIDAHANPPLHLGDPEPVRIVALAGDITGPVTFDAQGRASIGRFAILPKPFLIAAGGDVRDTWIFGQNLRAEDVSRIEAGGRFAFSTVGGGGSRARIELGGPGRLEIGAGGDVDLADSQGIVTRGNLNNPALPEQGAAVVVLAGTRSADYAGLFARSSARAQGGLVSDLVERMRIRLGAPALDAEAALAAYAALSHGEQSALARAIVFDTLRATGRAAISQGEGLGSFAAGYDAIADLFPERPGGYRGDVNLFFSQIKTEQGGDIEILVPGGVVNAGLASAGGTSKPASELGIVTVRGGTIRSLVSDDFLVNQSRVFTLQGGDILIWSSEGNIDAGRGAKSASATPPPQVITRGDQIVLDITNSISGSGIGVLLARDGVVPGDVDLIAPRGEVSSGEAPIRAAGNVNVAALRVSDPSNIQAGGALAGVPVQAPPALAATAPSTNVSGDATRSVEQVTRAAAAAAAAASQLADSDQARLKPTLITVEVLGFGDEGRPSDDARRR